MHSPSLLTQLILDHVSRTYLLCKSISLRTNSFNVCNPQYFSKLHTRFPSAGESMFQKSLVRYLIMGIPSVEGMERGYLFSKLPQLPAYGNPLHNSHLHTAVTLMQSLHCSGSLHAGQSLLWHNLFLQPAFASRKPPPTRTHKQGISPTVQIYFQSQKCMKYWSSNLKIVNR